jgi:hypothetical protein
MATLSDLQKALVGFPRDLKWTDFRSPVGSEVQNPFAAETASKFSVTDKDYGFVPFTEPVSFHSVKVRVLVELVTDATWAKDNAKTNAALLAHEQGHFDITGLIARDLARSLLDWQLAGQEMKDLQTKGMGQRPGNMDAPYFYLWKKKNEIVDAAKLKAEKLLSILQTTPDGTDGIYDLDTAHGTDVAAQKQWSDLLNHAKQTNLSFENTLRAHQWIS